jgi:hypothetical protein
MQARRNTSFWSDVRSRHPDRYICFDQIGGRLDFGARVEAMAMVKHVQEKLR